MEIDYNKIGKTIRNIRNKEEMTQDQLSEYVGISPGYLSKIEGGFAKPSLEILFSIAESLGVTLNDLIYSRLDIDKYEMAIQMINNVLEECTPVEKELFYTVLKSFVDFLIDRGIRL